MNLSEPFIRRPVMTAVLTASAILFGLLAYWQLPVNDLPAVDYPVIQVNCGYPGASPETVAGASATSLERQVAKVRRRGARTESGGRRGCRLVLEGRGAVDVV